MTCHLGQIRFVWGRRRRQEAASLLLIELARSTQNELFIAFMDYEKAFDFMNREILINKLVDQNIGKRFVAALTQMYSFTAYTPKESGLKLGGILMPSEKRSC